MVHRYLQELRAGTSSNRRSRCVARRDVSSGRGEEAPKPLSSTYRTGRRSLPAHGAWITLAFVITDLAATREGMVAVRDGERWLLENRAMKDGVLDRLLVRVSGGRPWKSVGGDDGRTWSEPRLGIRGDAGEMSTPVLVRMEPPRCPKVTSAGGDTPWRHRATYDNLMTAHPPRVPFPRLRDERRTTPSIILCGRTRRRPGRRDVDPVKKGGIDEHRIAVPDTRARGRACCRGRHACRVEFCAGPGYQGLARQADKNCPGATAALGQTITCSFTVVTPVTSPAQVTPLTERSPFPGGTAR